MAKPVITPQQFIAEANKRLPANVQLFLTPRGATIETATGYDWTNRDSLNAVTAVKLVVDQLAEQYEVHPALTVGGG
ncbi:hypothetical protein [Bordetella flabilis]|uniref:Uncharacterized protein n=1 Tax=Bordetella flabilis TaxID=463014 RepID=A0A193GI32_9BORD|nr:hypothetical protein [Bordetella flabilis]ANN78934.1 hypothetical protein BAU07_19025 [Bordetella flabilis]